jgi:hypothetical protein
MPDSDTGSEPVALPPDYVDLLKKQRELAMPASRIASYDEFAKWLFTIATIVGTLGAAFSSAALKNLQGYGSVLFFAAIAATGASLALAVILRTIEPRDANWQNLEDMLEKTADALKVKRRLAWSAGGLFAIAIVLAGISPLASNNQTKAKAVVGQGISYSYGKDGLHVTAVLARPALAIGEVRVSAIMPNGELLVAAQRAAADEQGAIHLDVNSVAIPSASTALKITLVCGANDDGCGQGILVPLRSANGTLPSAANGKGRASAK